MSDTIAQAKGFRINSDDSFDTFEFTNDDFLSKGQEIVGGLIEAVDLPKLGLSMWVNEEGSLLDLPVNDVATAIVAFAYSPQPTIQMKGNAFFTSINTDAEGYVLGLDDKTVEQLLNLMKGIRDELGN